MAKRLLVIAAVCVLLASVRGITYGQEQFTPQLAKEKVNAAIRLFEKEGEAAYPKFKDPAGEFRFAGGEGYIWIHSLSGIMVMHSTRRSLEGQSQLDLKDSQGFAFIAAMNQLVEKYNEGWVVYLWPKPGHQNEELKASFVKLATWNGRKYVVGCGMYGVTKQSIQAALPRDVVCDLDMFNKGI